MFAISDTTRLVIWIVTGLALAVAGVLTAVLNDNLIYWAKRLFRVPIPEGEKPPRPRRGLLVVYALSMLIVIVGTAVASAAPAIKAAAEQIEITSPVKPGENAVVTVKTEPGAQCSLAYETPVGGESQAQGLGMVTADGNGICTWAWTIGINTTPGTGHLTIVVEDETITQTIEITE